MKFRIFLLFLILISFPKYIFAANAKVYFKNRLFPLYIKNIQFFYYGTLVPVPAAILTLKEQKFKYVKYEFNKIRKIEFVKVAGERNSVPVYYIKLWLKTGGNFIHGFLLPLSRIQGVYGGREWKFYLKYGGFYQENISNLKEIYFLRD